ncbi:MAG: hypothetical protein PHS79_05105 [Patescibacteria group bacterium]|nr:hypothetical protein [Patescibacteria group bacterium]
MKKGEFVAEYGTCVLIIEEDDFPLDADNVMQVAWDLGAAEHNEDPDNPDSLLWIRFPGKEDELCGSLLDLRNAIYFEENRRSHARNG